MHRVKWSNYWPAFVCCCLLLCGLVVGDRTNVQPIHSWRPLGSDVHIGNLAGEIDNDDSFGKYATAAESDSGFDPTFQQLMKHDRKEGDADAGYDDLMALMQELKANKPKRVYPYTQGQYARGRRRRYRRSFRKYATPEQRVKAAVDEVVDEMFKRRKSSFRNVVKFQWKPRLPGFGDLVRKIKNAKNKIFRKLNPLGSWARRFSFNRIKNSVRSIGRNIVNRVRSGASGVVRSITGGISRSARGIISRVTSGIKQAANSIISRVRGIGGNVARTLTSKIGGAARSIGNKIRNSFRSVGQRIFSNVKRIGGGIINGVKRFGTGILRHVKNVGQRAANSVRNVGTMIVRQVKSAGSKIFGHVRQFGSSLKNKVRSFTANIWGSIKRTGKKLLDSAKKAWGTASGAGRKILSTMKRFGSKVFNHIKSITKKAWGNVKNAGKTIWKTIKKAGKFLYKFAKSPMGQMILRVAMQAGLASLGVPPMVSGPLVGTALGIINGQKPMQALLSNVMTALPGGPQGPLAGILKQVTGGGQLPPAGERMGDEGEQPPEYEHNEEQEGEGPPPGGEEGPANYQGPEGSNQGKGPPPKSNKGKAGPPSKNTTGVAGSPGEGGGGSTDNYEQGGKSSYSYTGSEPNQEQPASYQYGGPPSQGGSTPNGQSSYYAQGNLAESASLDHY